MRIANNPDSDLTNKSFQTGFMAPRRGSHFYVMVLWFVLIVAGTNSTRLSAQTIAPQAWVLTHKQMQVKNPAAALPFLEQLVREYPDVVLYRLELGYALYLLGRDSGAQLHFQQARGANLTDEQRRAVDVTLARIAARKVWSVRLGFSIEPSTNAGKGTAAGSVDVGGLIIPIPDNLRIKSATGALVSAGFTYRPKLTQTLEATLSLDTLIKYYEERTLRETLVVGRAGLRWSPRQNVFVEGGVLYGTKYAAGSPYNDRCGIFSSYRRPLGNRASFRLGFEHYRTSYDTFALADGPSTQIDAQFAYALAPNALLRARGYVLHTNANGTLQSGWQGALTLGGTYAFKGGLVAMLDMTNGLDKRDGFNPLIGERREDRSFSNAAEFYNSKYQICPFSPVLRLKFERNKSNQVINSYTNRSINVGLRTAF